MNKQSKQAALLGLDDTLINAIDIAGESGTILREANSCPVLDKDGKPLEIGKIYTFPNGELFRPTKWLFGNGNFMDSYYWVWGISSNLKDTRITVDATHTKNGRYYQSQLSKQS